MQLYSALSMVGLFRTIPRLTDPAEYEEGIFSPMGHPILPESMY